METPQPHNDNVGRIITIGATTTAIATIAVSLRLYTRLTLVRLICIEDILAVVSLILSIVSSVLVCMRTRYGLGRHIWDINPSPEEDIVQMKLFYSSIITYNAALTVLKTSFLLTYLRIFPTKFIRKASYFLLSVVICFGLWLFFGSVFTCTPIASFWDPTIPGKCLDSFGLWMGNSVVNIVTDFAIFFLPIPVINKMNLAKKIKISLMVVFALGFLECLVSIIRLEQLKLASVPPDFTYNAEGAATWSMIELNLGIVCACLPTLRPLIAKFIPQFSPNFYTPPLRSIFWQSVQDNRKHTNKPWERGGEEISEALTGSSSAGFSDDGGEGKGEVVLSTVPKSFANPPPQAHTRGERGYMEML